jgi:hypothetical protein
MVSDPVRKRGVPYPFFHLFLFLDMVLAPV